MLVVAKACSTLVGTDEEIVSPHARVTSNRHRHRDFFRKIDRNRSKITIEAGSDAIVTTLQYAYCHAPAR